MSTGPKRRGADHALVTRRDGAHHVAAERLVEVAHLPPELGGHLARGVGLRVKAHTRAVLGVRHAPADPESVQPAADQADAARVLAGELLGRDRGRCAGTKRGHRPRVEQRDRLAALGVRDHHDAGHGRQATPWVPGKGGDPFEDCEPFAAHRHRAEVAVRRARQVELRRHLPLAPGEADEALAHTLDRLGRGHGGEHGVVIEHGYLCHARKI